MHKQNIWDVKSPSTHPYIAILAHSKEWANAMVRRPSSVHLWLQTFARIASSRRQMAGSPSDLHMMDSRSVCIQGVLKVEVNGHVIRALLYWHENRFFSQANGSIATKLPDDGLQVSLHPGCSQGQGQGQRSRDKRTFLEPWNELLCRWRSGWTCLPFQPLDDALQISWWYL